MFDLDEDVTSRMYSKLVNSFMKNGYSCLDIQHLPDEILDADNLEFVLEGAAEELNIAIKSSSIPFPPVLVSHSLSALVTQTYVSSFPATALILVSPPPNVSEALSILRTQETSPFKELFRLDMKEFNFEPWFPIAVFVGKGNGMKETMERECRLVREGADLVEVEGLAQGLSGEGNVNLTDLREKMHTWMDEVGV